MNNKQNNNNLIGEQIKKVADVKSRAAVQEQFAHDYMDIKGVRFHKATVAHAWFFARVQVVRQVSLLDYGTIIAYSLAHDQEGVRNKLMAQISDGSIADQAYAFMIDNQLEVKDCEIVAKNLTAGILKEVADGEDEEKKTTQDSTITGGAQSSINSQSTMDGQKT